VLVLHLGGSSGDDPDADSDDPDDGAVV
jgi:hypothetical protein